MKNYDKYYRRAHTALKKLIEAYKDGYDIRKMNEFRTSLIREGINNPKVMREQQFSLLFTITTALLGLNKEGIEKTEKIREYKKAEKSSGIGEETLTKKHKDRIQEFNDKRVEETPFDNWLSIVKNLTKEKDSTSIMKKIRNGILHSNFELLLEEDNLDYTNIKIKSYFEAELLNLEFEKYILEYFSNIEGLGLTEVMHTYNIRQIPIRDRDVLHRILLEMSINEIRYKNIGSLGEKTPEIHLMEARNEDDKIDVLSFLKNLKESNNFKDLTGEILKLKPETIRYLEDYIEKTFGNKFYELDYRVQDGIISTHLNLVLNPKRELSNWYAHFWFLYSTLTAPNFTPEFFSGDDYGFESCYPALLILKAYLTMYRLQCPDFSELDYKKVNFPDDGTVELVTGNINDPDSDENSFKISIEKEQERHPELDIIEVFNKVMCDVVRNSLAHGNVNVYISPLTLERKISLTDTDPKSGRIRKLIFELDGFNKFLESEAFLPKNCYNKTEETSKPLVKEK